MQHTDLLSYYENLTYQEFNDFSPSVIESYSHHIYIKKNYNLPLSREEEIILEFILKKVERDQLETIFNNDKSN